MVDISAIHNKLIGLCCLEGEEADKVRKLWQDRFYEQNTFWVDVHKDQDAEAITDAVAELISAQGITHMDGENCMMAVYLDVTQPLDEQLIQQLTRVPNLMKAWMKCSVNVVYQFAYCGTMRSSEERANCREGIEKIRSQSMQGNHLSLVARQYLAKTSSTHWEATVVCMDILRRHTYLTNLSLGGRDDIGFMRYGSYDAQMRERINLKQEELKSLLSEEGEQAFRDAVRLEADNMCKEIREALQVDGSMQPIHPDMQIKKGYFKRRKALKNKDDDFANAQTETRAALRMTAQGIVEEAKRMAARTEQGKALLERLLRQTGVGMMLEEQSEKMLSALNPSYHVMYEPKMPDLSYDPDGYTEKIGKYFNDMVEYAIYLVRKDFLAGLVKAYEERRANAENVNDRAIAINRELEQLNHQLSGLPNEEDFCRGIANDGKSLERWFSSQLSGGQTERFVLCTNKADAERMENYGIENGIRVFMISGLAAGLKEISDTSLKALHIVSLPYSEEQLNHLIPEV